MKDLIAALGHPTDLAGLEEVPISADTPGTDHWFAPVSPEVLEAAGERIPASLDLTNGPPSDLADLADEFTDIIDQLVVNGLIVRGARSIWRAWRFAVDRAPASARRVYIAEVEPRVEAWDVTQEIQRKLTERREEFPQVEVYWVGDELFPYHQTARAHAALLWTEEWRCGP